MLTFKPLTEEEIEMASVWPKGIYKGYVISSEHKISKASNSPMIQLIIELYDSNHQKKVIYCYLTEKMPKLLKHLCDILGLEQNYNSGALSDDLFRDANVAVSLGIQEDKTGQYPTKNVILDFIKQAKEEAAPFDDDVPF